MAASASPRFATPRNPERPSLGAEVCTILRRLGMPPMPWQEQVLDVALEVDEHGRLWYREVRLTIQRQAGKTTLALGLHIARHLHSTAHGWGKRPVTLYTAQSASAARDKLVEEWWPIIEDSPYFGDVEQMLRSNGRESIKWNPPGGRLLTVPPTRTGGHGITGVDLCHVDEAFAHRDATVEQGVRPTMITRTSPQLWIVSTAGTAESEYLWGKVDDGRQRCESGDFGRVAYLEWSAYKGALNSPVVDGDVYDIRNPDELMLTHPAVNHTMSVENLLADINAMDYDEALRAYGNIWTTSVARIIPAQAWNACLEPSSQITGRMYLAVDSGPGTGTGRTGAIAVAGRNAAGLVHGEVIDSAPGLSWIADRVGQLTRQWRNIQSVSVDPFGPIASILPDIKRASACNVIEIEARDMTAACQRFHEDVLSGDKFRHIGQDVLNKAVDGAAKRQLLDSWAWTRRQASADIAPLVAVTEAYWQAVTHPQENLRFL